MLHVAVFFYIHLVLNQLYLNFVFIFVQSISMLSLYILVTAGEQKLLQMFILLSMAKEGTQV